LSEVTGFAAASIVAQRVWVIVPAMRTAMLSVILSMLAGAASAAPRVLGVEVGAPMTLPECDLSSSLIVKQDCQTAAAHGDNLEIVLSDATTAHAGFVRHAEAVVDDGVVTALLIRTSGVYSQDEVMHALTAKFGRPRVYRVERPRDRLTSTFRGVRARWQQAGLIVTFDSAAGSLDNGELDITSPAHIRPGGGGGARMDATDEAPSN
jgi:hypothetical protein